MASFSSSIDCYSQFIFVFSIDLETFSHPQNLNVKFKMKNEGELLKSSEKYFNHKFHGGNIEKSMRPGVNLSDFIVVFLPPAWMYKNVFISSDETTHKRVGLEGGAGKSACFIFSQTNIETFGATPLEANSAVFSCRQSWL